MPEGFRIHLCELHKKPTGEGGHRRARERIGDRGNQPVRYLKFLKGSTLLFQFLSGDLSAGYGPQEKAPRGPFRF